MLNAVVLRFIACNRRVDLFVYTYFFELTSLDYVPKMRIRLIEKALNVCISLNFRALSHNCSINPSRGLPIPGGAHLQKMLTVRH